MEKKRSRDGEVSSPDPIDQESARKAEHDKRMGWRGFPLLQSRSEVRQIQSTKRALGKRSMTNGWDGSETQLYPIDQDEEKKILIWGKPVCVAFRRKSYGRV